MATDLARTSLCNPRTRHGSVVVSGGRIIGKGVNAYRNAPGDDIPGDCIAVHAEIAALRSCGRTPVKGGTLYVARIGAAGDIRMSKPCKNCQKAIAEAGIKKVVYTIESTMVL